MLHDDKVANLAEHTKDIQFEPNYNARPGQQLPVILLHNGKPFPKRLIWGIEATFGGKNKLVFNSKIENLSSPFWKRMEPCLVPANGFYEWDRVEGKSIPYYFKDKQADLVYLAGLYLGGRFSVITTEATGAVKKIHNRMPVILKPKTEVSWLNGELPVPYDNLKSYRVTNEVNNARINKEELVYPLKP